MLKAFNFTFLMLQKLDESQPLPSSYASLFRRGQSFSGHVVRGEKCDRLGLGKVSQGDSVDANYN